MNLCQYCKNLKDKNLDIQKNYDRTLYLINDSSYCSCGFNKVDCVWLCVEFDLIDEVKLKYDLL